MAKKTAGRRLALRDTSRAIERQFLSYADDAKDIYYEYDEPAQDAAPAEDEKAAQAPAAAIPKPKPEPTAAPPVPPSQPKPVGAATQDVPLSATDIVLAIVASKLKQPFDQVSLQKSIRDLSGGEEYSPSLVN